jgi:integrase
MTKQRASLLRSRWKNYFEPRFGDLRIRQVEAEVSKFATWLASEDGRQIRRIADPENPGVEIVLRGPKLSATTGTEMLDTLRQFVAWASKAKNEDGDKIAHVDPIEKRIKVKGYRPPAERKPKGRYLTEAEIGALIDAAATCVPRAGVHNLELLLLELGVAARIGSLTTITDDQVKLDHDVINLLPEGEVQTPKGRPCVPISGPMRAILEHRVANPGIDRRLIVYRGEGVSADTRGQVMRRLRERAKLKDPERVNWYSIRHTLSDWIDTRGISQRARSMTLGHIVFSDRDLRLMFDNESPTSKIYRSEKLEPLYEIRDLLEREWWPHLQEHCKSVFEKRHGARLTSVAMAAMVMRVSATAVSCS